MSLSSKEHYDEAEAIVREWSATRTQVDEAYYRLHRLHPTITMLDNMTTILMLRRKSKNEG